MKNIRFRGRYFKSKVYNLPRKQNSRGELCQQITQEAKRLTFRSPARVQAIYGGHAK